MGNYWLNLHKKDQLSKLVNFDHSDFLCKMWQATGLLMNLPIDRQRSVAIVLENIRLYNEMDRQGGLADIKRNAKTRIKTKKITLDIIENVAEAIEHECGYAPNWIVAPREEAKKLSITNHPHIPFCVFTSRIGTDISGCPISSLPKPCHWMKSCPTKIRLRS